MGVYGWNPLLIGRSHLSILCRISRSVQSTQQHRNEAEHCRNSIFHHCPRICREEILRINASSHSRKRKFQVLWYHSLWFWHHLQYNLQHSSWIERRWRCRRELRKCADLLGHIDFSSRQCPHEGPLRCRNRRSISQHALSRTSRERIASSEHHKSAWFTCSFCNNDFTLAIKGHSKHCFDYCGFRINRVHCSILTTPWYEVDAFFACDRDQTQRERN
mmetsp:Transcript_35857/g.39988  ORF Transcript_35857/g.39988 Transcript_35857/m.39988 type:complete len:218 (+) Transcript_35857:587-1240(+)